MGYIIENEFYFRCYKIFIIKGIWLRLRTKTSPVLPAFFHCSLTFYCSPIHYRTEQTDLILASGPMNLLLPEFQSDQFHPAITGWQSHLALCISLLSAK